MFQAQKPSRKLLSEIMIRELENFATFDVQTLHARTVQNNMEIFDLSLPVCVHNVETHFIKVYFSFSEIIVIVSASIS